MTNPSKNSFVMFAAFFIGAFLNYAFNVVMGWMLTPAQFGMLGVSASFLLILSLFVTSAFPLTTTKFISGKHDRSTKHRVFKSALIANIGIAVLLSVLFYISYTTNIIDLGASYNLLVIGILLATILTAMAVIYFSILQGTFRFKSFAFIGIITIFAKLISGVILVKMGFGALGAVLSFPISVFIGLSLAILLTRDFTFWKTKGWADTNVYFFALPMFFGTLGTTLLMNIDIIGVKFLTDVALSDALSGYYRAALILAQLPIFMVGALMSVLFPYISKHTENDRYASKSIKYGALFILPLALVIAAVPDAFILLMFPPEYIASAPALAIVAIGMGFLVMTMVFTNIFQARNVPRIPAIVLPLAVIIEIILLILLVPSYGIVGAAASTTIACSIGCTVMAGLYVHTYKLKLDHLAMVKTLVSFCILLLVLYTLPHTGLFPLVGSLTLSGIVYLVVLASFRLLTEEDASIFLAGMPNHKAVTPIAEMISRVIKKLNRV
ncbi:flippase [Methanococcoides burtonii]|uniref:Polysaccharide biosynthesis protein, membrane-associated n=1 Tax=Methanococcoides burtonii (strain DSM 6242 / NBRC 107633 / OCM 468 / ACE-M) TaxID=259564 RepID=Q12TY8_METBU|nr:flippase [Methanococcoides burtonii]ABE53088.1 Polysaccharide biosynthesis protein, membrane-associated [Methanococcoides burtonii DSM 6242]